MKRRTNFQSARYWKQEKEEKKIFHKTPEFLNGFYGTLLALVLSPFSILIGFKLNEVLSKPVLTIENISANQISKIIGIENIELYFSNSILYNEYKLKNLSSIKLNLQSVQDEEKTIAPQDLFEYIIEDVDKFNSYLLKEQIEIKASIKSINDLQPSEVRISYLINSEDNQQISDVENMREKLKYSILKKESDLGQSIADLERIKRSISIKPITFRLQISILNNGATDGLVRNEGLIRIGNKEYIIERIPPPSSKANFNAVPVFEVNPNNDLLLSNSVGRVEKNTMVDYWYKIVPKDSISTNLCEGGKYEVVLFDQNKSAIAKKEICKN